MFKKTLCNLAVAGAVLAFIPAECFAWGRAEVEAACEAMNATYSTSSQRCVCKPGFTESNNTCVPSGGSSGGSAGSGYDNGAAIREQQRREAERRAEEERQAELERQRREAENKRRIEEAARQAKFLEDRDAAASTLRGSTGTGVSASGGLRGSTATSNSTGLRGSSTDTGLRTGTTVTPNTDPMVVDARNVPSGLPKSVDDAIPHTPSGERVRKGFQAIQDGDWKVALAWFKDALNKEPGNSGIARLVDLAQFTLDYRTQAQTPEVKKSSTPVRSTQSPNQNTPIKSIGGADAKPANGVDLAAASQMAARKRADAAFRRYVEKYGERDAVGRASAVSGAMRGEGYTNEELKAQLQKALIDYRKDHRKNHPDGPDESVGGSSPTADAILTGEKQ